MDEFEINGEKWVIEPSFPDRKSGFAMVYNAILHDETSAYQRIQVVYTEKFGNVLLLDGSFQVAEKGDYNSYHEMMAHIPMFTHQSPKNILIIGGGDCGIARELLKHNVNEVVLVDIDERVTGVTEVFIPHLCESNNDPRLTLDHMDAADFVKNPGQMFDVIIIDSTDPSEISKELFSEEFYRNCAKILSPGGIICQQTESPQDNPDLLVDIGAEIFSAGFEYQIRHIFQHVLYQSGMFSCTLFSTTPIPPFRMMDSINKNFETSFYNVGMHIGSSYLPEYLMKKLDLANFDLLKQQNT
jgi:spermidine synthase